MTIIKDSLEDLQIRLAIINSNEDLKTLSQVKTVLNDISIDLKDELEKDEDPNYPDLDPYFRDQFKVIVEWCDESYAKLDRLFQKLFKQITEGANNGRTEE